MDIKSLISRKQYFDESEMLQDFMNAILDWYKNDQNFRTRVDNIVNNYPESHMKETVQFYLGSDANNFEWNTQGWAKYDSFTDEDINNVAWYIYKLIKDRKDNHKTV